MDTNALGNDVHNVNVLTVIASESYDSFAKGLQTELAEAVADRPRAVTAELFKGKVIKDSQGNETVVDADLASSIVYEMTVNRYIDRKGILTDKYYEDKANGNVQMPEEVADCATSIIEIVDSVYSAETMKPENARSNNVELQVDEEKLNSKEFRALWSRINAKSVYVVDFDTDELVRKAIAALDAKLHVSKIYFKVETGSMSEIKSREDLVSGTAFMKEESDTYDTGRRISANKGVKYDLVGKLVDETGLTRKAIIQILTGIQPATFGQFKDNPEEFIIRAAQLINDEKATAIIEHITYDVMDDHYGTDIFTEPTIKGKLDVNAKKVKKGLYDHVVYDSTNERDFVTDLDTNQNVAVYVKLPDGFYISTPVGHYNPDWAIAFYLDLKPDNILTLEGSLDLVQLFDFDSMISMEDLQNAIRTNDPSRLRTSYTRGYASLEQQTGKLRQLGKHSDMYSLGAVLFYALWHKTPSAFDCEPDAAYDFSDMTYAGGHYQDRLFRALTHFFHKTLASYYADRYQDADEAIAQLGDILILSDDTKPWVYSTPVKGNIAFYGRQKEIKSLSDLLEQTGHGIASLYGMGGIGKSTLVRKYIADHSADWDAVIWLYDQRDLAKTITDDTLVQINTVHRLKEESTEEYLQRKIQALSSIAVEQRILLVIDNFELEHLEQLDPFRPIGWTILLISRERMPEGMFPAMQVEELDEDALALLFRYYSHCDLEEEQDQDAFRTIISCINGHTLLTELIARQISKSYLDIQAAEAMVAGIGLTDLPEEKIEYVHDQSAWHGTLLKILDRLVEIDRFSEQDRVCMKLLSLFYAPGIDAELFKSLAEMDSLDVVNELETSGWVKRENRNLYLHPMMREYIRTWLWTEEMEASAEKMMRNLYERIRPAGTRHDGSRQFPEDYDSLYRLLSIAQQMVDNADRTTEASQHLLFRLLMDAPVDQDTPTLFRMLELLEDPKYLDDSSILRLYETAAYYRARLYMPDDAIEILKDMKRFLRKHPSAYYLSAYHRAMGVILHNANRDLKIILSHEDKAIAAARVSTHPEAKKQLAACLMNKARTLMSEGICQDQVKKLILEAEPIVSKFTEPLDYERYQFSCNAAMFFAMEGEADAAQAMMDAADAIAYASPDSDLSVAEHLIEEVAPFRMEMGQLDRAAATVIEAINICGNHLEALRYRETIFDAYLFLGRIYAMDGKYIESVKAFAEAEKRVADSPYEWKLPLCPEDIREKAEKENFS